MSSFTSPLIVSPLLDGKSWRLYKSFTYRIGSRYSKRKIAVPSGFITDFASIPKFIFWLLPWWSKFSKAPVLHDWLYREKQITEGRMFRAITRKQADDIFYEAMLLSFRMHGIMGKFIARIEYWSVRIWGWLAWER